MTDQRSSTYTSSLSRNTDGGSNSKSKKEYEDEFGVKDDETKDKSDASDSSAPSEQHRQRRQPPQQRRLHVWTDHQVVLLLRAAVALKINPNSAGWGKMTGCYAEMARMLREAPEAAEEWGENIDSTLTVSKIRSKFESVSLLLASNKYRVRSKDPKTREELQDLYSKLHALQTTRVALSPQEAQKRWRDELEKLRQLWMATRKTSIPRSRAQSALKTIRDLKKLRPQFDDEGNCVFPKTVLFDGSSELVAQAQAAVALAKNDGSNPLGSGDDGDDQVDDEDEASDSACGVGAVEQQDDHSLPQIRGDVHKKDLIGLLQQDDAAHIQHVEEGDGVVDEDDDEVVGEVDDDVDESGKRSRSKNEGFQSFVPEKKSRNVVSSLPSEETCKELSVLLQQSINTLRSLHFCSSCDENGERCNCRFTRTELLRSSQLTDSCPACHHPICHHP